MNRHRPRRRFGQHFLVDEVVLERMMEYIAPKAGDLMLEVGPGEGALTCRLLNVLDHLVAVELDRDLAAALRGRSPKLELLEADVLRLDWGRFLARGDCWRIVGNLPYNISTPFLGRLQEFADHVRDAHFLLQKEVVDRLAASPGTKQWGRLTVMIQYQFDVEALFAVSPAAFRPPPKVDSAFVRLLPRAHPQMLVDARAFSDVVATAFQQRRKTLSNALKSFAIQWDAVPVDATMRPDQLDVSGYVALANQIAGSRND